jgi:hypothetical protein
VTVACSLGDGDATGSATTCHRAVGRHGTTVTLPAQNRSYPPPPTPPPCPRSRGPNPGVTVVRDAVDGGRSRGRDVHVSPQARRATVVTVPEPAQRRRGAPSRVSKSRLRQTRQAARDAQLKVTRPRHPRRRHWQVRRRWFTVLVIRSCGCPPELSSSTERCTPPSSAARAIAWLTRVGAWDETAIEQHRARDRLGFRTDCAQASSVPWRHLIAGKGRPRVVAADRGRGSRRSTSSQGCFVKGRAVVVSPLIALQDDQLAHLPRRGLTAIVAQLPPVGARRTRSGARHFLRPGRLCLPLAGAAQQHRDAARSLQTRAAGSLARRRGASWSASGGTTSAPTTWAAGAQADALRVPVRVA